MGRRCLCGFVILVILSVAADNAPSVDPALTTDEKTILELTNKARAEQNLPLLSVNLVLTRVAREHSQNMAGKGEMNHILDGKTPAQRVKAAGYRYVYTGENIAMGENVSVQEIFDSWMKSKGHRENILKEEYREIGIGVAHDDKGKIYYTQEFGSRDR
jgi:uncharacterized protein YkwD